MHDEVMAYKGNNLQLCGWCTFEKFVIRKAKCRTWFGTILLLRIH